MNVSVSADTPVSRSPRTNWAMSTMCAPMSPSAPEPAFSACSRQTSGNSGSTIQSCRYWRAHVPDLPDPAVGHQLPGQRHRRHPPVVEADHAAHPGRARPVGRGHHRARLVDRVGQRLLAQHVLAGVQRGDGDLGVRVAGRAHVDERDVVPFQQLLPVRLHRTPAQPPGRRAGRVGVPAAEHGQIRLQRQVEEAPRGPPGLGVGRAHEGVAHHPDPEQGVVGHRHIRTRSPAAGRCRRSPW